MRRPFKKSRVNASPCELMRTVSPNATDADTAGGATLPQALGDRTSAAKRQDLGGARGNHEFIVQDLGDDHSE